MAMMAWAYSIYMGTNWCPCRHDIHSKVLSNHSVRFFYRTHNSKSSNGQVRNINKKHSYLETKSKKDRYLL